MNVNFINEMSVSFGKEGRQYINFDVKYLIGESANVFDIHIAHMRPSSSTFI